MMQSKYWGNGIVTSRTYEEQIGSINLVVLIRDKASEYKSEEIMQLLESKGIRSYFSTPEQQWQNGAAE